MTRFRAPDGTGLAYRPTGAGEPLVCLPGGPMQASDYLGDLGGLSASVRLVLLDLRGTGRSDAPSDPLSYRCDRQVEDVEALRAHLDLPRLDLLAHSAGANLAVGYAVRHPDRVGRLVLVTPSVRAVGIDVDPELRREVIDLRRDDPLHAEVSRAYDAIVAGRGTAQDEESIVPFRYGRWDHVAQEAHARSDEWLNAEAAEVFSSDGAFDPTGARAGLARLGAPVLVVAGELDIAAPPRALAEYAALFEDARLVTLPGAGHSPWLDDPDAFTAAVAAFLGS